MMTSPTPPDLRPFNAAGVPAVLRQHQRWAPWRAVWNAKRGKYDKIPHRPDQPAYGLSTAHPERWGTFDQALAAWQAAPDRFAGLGYVMTGPHGVVGIDLDNCIDDSGVLAPWASEVTDSVSSYTEVSPSGRGLRILVLGEVGADWTNHDIGIEVYGGNEARFLTITGDRLLSTPDVVPAPDGALPALEARYARERRRAEVIDLNMPDLVDDLLLPSLENLDISYAARDFLATGAHGGDRSQALFATTVALYSAGLPDDQVFSLLAQNPHAMEIALDHRRQDPDRAQLYLWREHCCKGKARATPRVTSDEFDDVTPSAAQVVQAKQRRFQFVPAAEFIQGEEPEYLVEDVLPQAALGVVFGESGSGKTFLVIDMMAAVARGTPWRDKPVKQGLVAYVCAEGATGFKRRLRAYEAYHGAPLPDLPIHVLADAPNLMEANDVRDLILSLHLVKPSVVVVDTLSQSIPGANENSGEDLGRALARCRAIHKATGALVLLVHHSGKDSSKGARGWSGLRAAADVEIEVLRIGDDRVATISKMKDGEDGQEFGFKLVTVQLGQNTRGREITSCVVCHTAAVAKAERRTEPKGDVSRLALKMLDEMAQLGDTGGVDAHTLVEAIVAQMLPPDEGKRDRRSEIAKRQLEHLRAQEIVVFEKGEVRRV